MTFNFFRLVVLFTTPALRRAGAAAAMALALLLPAGAAQAALDHFNGGAVAGCTRSGTTYTCATLSQTNDITIASGYTVEVAGSVSFAWAQVLKMSGSATLRAGADLDLRGLQTGNTQVAGGTLAAGAAFRLGSNDQTVTADVSAASVATGGPSTRINGSVTATGLVDLGSNSTITGAVSAGSLKTSANITLGSSVTAGGGVDLGSNNTVAGKLSATTVTANANLQINGGIVASDTVDLGSNTTIKGGIASASAVTTGSNSTITGDVVASAFTLASGGSLTGDVKAPQVELSAANTSVTGNITASTSLVVGSGGSVTGKIDSPKVDLNASNVTIKGDIKADTSLTIGSGNTVNGNISGTSLTLASSNVIVNGNVTMKGDVDIGSGATINGDLSARNVTTHASGDTINGNAAVNAIFLDWGSSVSKTITCTGPGAVLCSCVTKADPNYKPSCGAAPPSGVHHFRITHNGSALTCQPQTVTVTACANSACTTPNYSASVTATLQPGGKSFTFTGGETTSATVEQSTAGTAVLSAAGALNATTCFNTADPTSARPCDMAFDTSGLTVTASDHVSMTPGATVTIQALKASPKNQSCVPLVASQKVNVNLSCKFSNPGPATAANANVKVDNAALDCRGNPVTVPLSFDGNGIATAALQYAEVGQVALNASYTGGGGFNAAGSGSFIAAPKALLIEAASTVTKANTTGLAAGAVFAKASEGFTVKVSAVNAETPPRVTTNFGKENTPESITITSAIANLDANGNPDPARQNGVISAGKFAPPSGGAYASVIDAAGTGLWSFSDTGGIKLDVTLLNSTGYYMGRAIAAFKTVGAQTVGRFIPDHFDTVLMTNAEIKASGATTLEGRSMSCANLGASTRPCPDTLGSFVHSGQPFFVKVLAYNGAATPVPTLNHTGTYAAAVALSAFTVADRTVAAPGATSWINPAGGAPASAINFSFDKGVGQLADPDRNLPRFQLPAAYPAKDVLPSTIYVRATDADGASSLRATPAASAEAQLTVVSGRLLIANTYGSPNSSVPVDASAQYYMPVGYVFNPQVQLTSGPIGGAITFDNCLKGLAGRCPSMTTAAKAAPPAALTLYNGKGTFRLAPPSPATTTIGSVDISLGALIYYLPSSIGRATFGIYRSGPVIYRREVY